MPPWSKSADKLEVRSQKLEVTGRPRTGPEMGVMRLGDRVALIASGATKCERPLQLHAMLTEKRSAGLQRLLRTRKEFVDVTNRHSGEGDVVELPIHCTNCGGALEAQCAHWRSVAPLTAQSFACPYCQKRNDLEMPARLIWVTRRATISQSPTTH